MRQLAYQHFRVDPQARQKKLDGYETGDYRRVCIAVAAAVAEGAMISIIGERGVGKTCALWRALRSNQVGPVEIIEPLRLDRERMHIGDIQTAIIEQLSQGRETVRHSSEARAGQTRRLLKAGKRPVLVIDEAHLLHHATVRALKRLRELGSRGMPGGLLSIILVGQHDPTANIAEVALRTDTLHLAGLTTAERRRVVELILGPCADSDAREMIIQSDAAANWLELLRLIDDCLVAGMDSKTLQAEAVARVLGQSDGTAAQTPALGRVAQTIEERAA